MRIAALAAVALFSFAAAAADPAPVTPGTPGHWSVATGETVSTDRDAISFEMGWPGLSFGYLHGRSRHLGRIAGIAGNLPNAGGHLFDGPGNGIHRLADFFTGSR